MHWFKIHHGFGSDAKFGLIARQLGIPTGNVISIALSILEYASHNDPRGSIEGINEEEIGFLLGYDTVTVRNALLSLRERGFHNGVFIHRWERYQSPIDHTNAERQKRFRENKKQEVTEKTSSTVTEVTERNALYNTEEIRKKDKQEGSLRSPSCADSRKKTSKSASPAIELDIDAGCYTGISQDMIERWRKAYPAINIEQCLQASAEWQIANPANRKKNHTRFITNWLLRQQERAPRANAARRGDPPTDPEKMAESIKLAEAFYTNR